MGEGSLDKWIRERMTVSDSTIIEENKEAISNLIGLTTDGKVVLKVDRSKLRGTQLVFLYLVGKLFAKVAGYTQDAFAKNSEISYELGLPTGSVGRCLSELRGRGLARSNERGHEAVLSALPSALRELSGGIVTG